jgi:uncharacterized protein with beta-barrel porin domain
MKSLLLSGVALAALTCVGSVARAQTAFILQDGTAGLMQAITTNLTSSLSTAGFTVSNGTSLPALASFKEVWDLEYNNTVLTAPNSAAYLAYLQAGGTLFLNGENLGFQTRNNSLLAFLATAGGGAFSSPAVTALNLQTVLGTVATTPNALPTQTYAAAAGLSNPGNGICITRDANGICSTIGFPVGSLSNAKKGTVVLVFDVDILDNFGNFVPLYIANLIAFLGSGGGGHLITLVPVTGLNTNQFNAAGGINNFVNNGGSLPPGFLTLLTLTPAQLGTALSQLSGEPATGAQQGTFELMNAFLGLMTDPFVDGRVDPGSGRIAFAAENETFSPEFASAYAAVYKAPLKAPALGQRWNVWGTAYGGTNRVNGDPNGVGSNDLSASAGGFATGADYRISPAAMVGFALGGGATNWSIGQGLGGGSSDAFQAGIYGKASKGPAYIAASFAFAEHWMSTNRIGFALDQLTAKFDAESYGGRVEVGYRVPASFVAVTPYAAIQAQAFRTPTYSETDLGGTGFGLTYSGRTATDTRSEVGARFDRASAFTPTSLLTLRAKLGYAHDWVSDPTLAAVFQTLPGSNFIVNGATPARDSGLASAGAELHFANGISIAAKFDGEFASNSQTYAGTGTVRYTW